MITNFSKLFNIQNKYHHIEITLFGIKLKIKTRFKPNKALEKYKIKNNKIFFISGFGGYNCNPKYILEEIKRQKLPYEIVWGGNNYTQNYSDSFPNDINIVLPDMSNFIKEFAESKIIITNDRLSNFCEYGISKK